MGRTHALLGISSLWLLTLVPPACLTANYGVLAACAAFGALVPDLDAAESKIKHLQLGGVKPFLLPSVAMNRELGHRGALHSLVGWALFAVLTFPLIGGCDWQPWVALLLGYGSHLMGDLCTVRGVPIFYPNPKRQSLLPKPLRFATGSLVEEALFALITLTALALLLAHLNHSGGALLLDH